MNKFYRNGLLMLVAGAFAVSCADYNVTDDFKADPDPSFVEPYKDYAPVKSYIDRNTYPNMSLGATLKVSEFNKQELAHAAAVTNFDNLAFGTTLMSGAIINAKGVMNFLDMMDLLDHVEEIGGEVFGSPIVANANQADDWLNMLTAPIEIIVEPIDDKFVDYTTMEEFTGTIVRDGRGNNKTGIVKNYDGNDNALKVPIRSKVYIVEGFDIDPLGTYTITFYAKVDNIEMDETIVCTFADNKIREKDDDKKFPIKPNKWNKMVIEAQPAEGATEGYFMIEGNLNADVYIKSVSVVHNPDNHRPQTAKEKKDTINYALNAWCEGLMKVNDGRIRSFDLIDEAIDSKTELENGMFDLKHSTDQVYWQDILGSENYAPAVAKAARTAYQKYEGDPSELKFFISETGLDDQKKFESLNYWINIWDANGAKIDGINAKLNLSYSEDKEKQEANVASLNLLLDNLASTGKLIRLSNFDIKYLDATGVNVAAKDITDEQRQALADYYGYVIKSYMKKIPHDKQAGICKGNLADTTDPVGLWSIKAIDTKGTKDWVRNATYKAFCDALSGK
ncbi:MAG: endo-1,4-beta-xylanase [Bacteroidaceae bacterium]|nr:endo-1,4-beta-xylanase [Bacteroidaceae bacterium]